MTTAQQSDHFRHIYFHPSSVARHVLRFGASLILILLASGLVFALDATPRPAVSRTVRVEATSIARPTTANSRSTLTTQRLAAAPTDSPRWRDAFAPATWSNWALAIFAAIAAGIALRTLRAIRRQANIANESLSAERAATEAAKASADAAKGQAELSQKTLVLTQRPKLIVRNIVVKTPGDPLRQTAPFQPGYSVEGEFEVVNIGGTPATITASGCSVFWDDAPLPMHRPYARNSPTNPVSGNLQPGTSVSGRFMSDTPMDQQATAILQASMHWAIYVMGWIEYKDDLGFIRRTAFCRRYDANRRRFFPVDDPDYEHAD